jgi:hypothetical protein
VADQGTTRINVRASAILALTAAVFMATPAQVEPLPEPAPAVVVAGEQYKAGAMREWILGETYRDLWTTPIEVPVLDLRTHAGGLKATKTGGGKQATNLRFENPDGYEFVFRKVDKDRVNPPEGWEKTIVEDIARDQSRAQRPVVREFLGQPASSTRRRCSVVARRSQSAGREVRRRLGIIGRFNNPISPGFAALIRSSTATACGAINRPGDRVDAREYLRARIIDIFLNDWDRHESSWKWAPMEADGPWIPVPDRDKVLLGAAAS